MKTLLMALALFAAVASCSAAETVATTVAAEYPYICSGALRDATISDTTPGVIAQTESTTVTQEELDAQIQKVTGSTREQLRRYPVCALQRYLTDRLLLVEAKAWAKANERKETAEDELIRKYLTAKTPKFEITEKDAEEFYKEHTGMSMFGGAPYEQIKSTVKYVARDWKIYDAQEQFSAAVGKRHKIVVSKAWMESEHTNWAKNPVEQARISGKPTYVNFGINACCDQMNPITEALRTEYAGKLNVVFVHVGEQEILGELYGINTVPIQFLFDKDGKLLLRHVGNMTKEQVRLSSPRTVWNWPEGM